MGNQKAAERDRVVYEFGLLLQPLEMLCRKPNPPSVAEYRVAIAQVQAGFQQWYSNVKRFATFADVVFQIEHQQIHHDLIHLWGKDLKRYLGDSRFVGDLAALQDIVRTQASEVREKVLNALTSIPIEWEPVVFQANTPFTAYLRIRECLTSVKERLNYFDRYLKPQFFQLFLEDIDHGAAIRLVTTRQGVDAVRAVSDLFRRQHPQYSLIEVAPGDLHDRNLRVDDQVFTLGPGVDRAGLALTNFGPGDSTATGHAGLDSIIAAGNVIHCS